MLEKENRSKKLNRKFVSWFEVKCDLSPFLATSQCLVEITQGVPSSREEGLSKKIRKQLGKSRNKKTK
jgi:hypothetical protein